MLRTVAICALLATPLLAASCGSSGDDTSEADQQAIRELVTELNRVTQEKDASGFCLITLPSAVDETFHDIDRCVRETEPILEAAGEEPVLEVEHIEVEGDLAKVTFVGDAGGEANFVREGSRWYVPLVPPGSTPEAESTIEGAEGPDGGDTGGQ